MAHILDSILANGANVNKASLLAALKGEIVTQTASAFTITTAQRFIIVNFAGTAVATLPSAANNPEHWFVIKTIRANAVNSASSNVEPIDSAANGTAILPATDGAWALLVSNGSVWVTMAKG